MEQLVKAWFTRFLDLSEGADHGDISNDDRVITRCHWDVNSNS